MAEEPSISLVTILHNWSNFCKVFQYTWDVLDYPKKKLEWIIVDTSLKDHSELIPSEENILYIRINSEDYLDKIDFKYDDDKVIWNYFSKTRRLPNGFLRDYCVGLSSNDYIMHVDFDTLYGKNTIQRKLQFLRNNKLKCVYCKEMIAYDIYGRGMYKVQTKSVGGFESTLFYTRDFWEQGGFKWEDIRNEGSSFCFGKGLERSMDNFYDCIKLLSIHNLNQYQPIKLEIENMKIDIPEIVHNLDISSHPISETIYDIYNDKNINVVGIESEIIDIIKKDNWRTYNVTDPKKKVKEKVILQKIKSYGLKNIDICIINTKYPIWSIFKGVQFDIVLLETNKNVDQMDAILKKNDFILFDNLYFNKKTLINEKM